MKNDQIKELVAALEVRKMNRFEVIDHSDRGLGREYVKFDIDIVEILL